MRSTQKTLDGKYKKAKKNSTNFVNNMSLPIHRWFRFPAGFYAEWVKKEINNNKNNEEYTVFDPFVGSGTTVLSAEESFIKGIGIDSHPFIVKIAQTKLLWREELGQFNMFYNKILNENAGLLGLPFRIVDR